LINIKINKKIYNIKKEIPELILFDQCKLIQDAKDIMNFKAVIIPESESYWYNGSFEFSLSVSDSYPFEAPKVKCLTKIYHPNIDFNGNVCLNILKEDWKPHLNISTVLAGIYFLFTDPNPNDPLNHEAATIMRDDLPKFISNVKLTLKGGKIFEQNFPYFV
jgi:ubiquitin-conjugating enzyme E2 M